MTPYVNLVIAPVFNKEAIFDWSRDFAIKHPGGSCDAVVIRNLLNENVYRHTFITFAIKCDILFYTQLTLFGNLTITFHHQDENIYYLLVSGDIHSWISNLEEVMLPTKLKLYGSDNPKFRPYFGKIFLQIEKALPEAVAHLHKVGQQDGSFSLRVKA